MVAPPPPAATTTVEKGTLEDANAGRAFFMGTALMPPAGTWSFEDYELMLIGGSYAVTDNFQLSVTTMVPVSSKFLPVFGSAKVKLLRAGNTHVALQGGVGGLYWNESLSTGSGTKSVYVGEIGAALTQCLDADCYTHVDGFAGTGFSLQSSNSSVPLMISGALVAKLGRRVRLVLEADTGHVIGKINDTANGVLVWYGLRFTSRQLGVDVGFTKPICQGCSDGGFPIGFPIVAFAYRNLD